MTYRSPFAIVAALAAFLLSACAQSVPPDPATDPQAQFWAALESHCGKAYAGELVSEDTRDADWQGRAMVAHWAKCDDTKIAIAFHIGPPSTGEAGGESDAWDRSRTWLVTRSEGGLRLKHDHRHADGEPDAVTFYGGDTAEHGTANAQDFPVDDESIALFQREGLDASLTNVWRLEATPAGLADAHFVYQLTRRNDPTRLFRVRFDASDAVDTPPPAWGW